MKIGDRLRKDWDGEELGEVKYIKDVDGTVYKIELIKIEKGESVWVVKEKTSK